MKHNYQRFWLLMAFFLLLQVVAFAQNAVTVSGTVKDKATGEELPAVSVTIKGKKTGTATDAKGHFTLKTTTPVPFVLIVSSIGFKPFEVNVTGNTTDLAIQLETEAVLGQEVVVAASRVEEKILESPVSIERMGVQAIKSSPAPSFYDALANLKGVEMSTQSLTFKSVSTRGFNANGNTRMVQLIDGMDNQAPGLNFSVGNIVGITELDMENAELLPGAASALYGPNAITGIVLLNSKSPFNYQGFSALIKGGMLSESNRSKTNTPYYDVALRYAKAFNNKFAFKLNFEMLGADDWQASDMRDQSLLNGFNLNNGAQFTNPAYNGVNTYGDELNLNMYERLLPAALTPGNPLGNGIKQLSDATGGVLTPQAIFDGMMPSKDNTYVSRTGYNERDLTDYNTKNLKFNGAFHYRINENVEAFVQGSYGYGTTVYTGADRYSIKNFNMGQYKAEVKGSNFYVRAYTTQEDAGDSYASGTLGAGINEAWKPSQTWFQQYFGTYATGALTTYSSTFQAKYQEGMLAGKPQPVAFTEAVAAATAAAKGGFGNFNTQARTTADQGRLMPGTAEFDAAAKTVREKSIPGDANGVGARFADKTNLYQVEGMYNFMNEIKFMEMLVGGNYRIYDLNSEKTLFALDENGGEFNIKEWGAYIQLGKKLFDDQLKLSGSLRYDKNMNFEGQFSPRLSAVLTVAKDHNFRASYQTGFRIPTTQDQYIDLVTPQAHLIGGLPFLRERYGLLSGPVYSLESVQAGNPQQYQFTDFKPEKVVSYELGYKALVNRKLLIDAYVYKSDYNNFMGEQVLVQPVSQTQQNIYSLPVNSTKTINTWGWALGMDYSLPLNFVVGGNVSFNKLTNEKDLDGMYAQFNTPEYRFNVNVGNRNIAKTDFGFNLTYRWQQEFIWQSSFVGVNLQASNGAVIPAYGSLDAQVSKAFPKNKTIIKLGASNLTNQSYRQAWGNPMVGTTGYISIGYNL
ncbi:TonB-dependent receptor [Solitalea longa]|uniref:TonB-dependent receptor n=1 Tax=Solitalea longa TaxID=2079460 RepID=A0A2S5A7U7_9SPHI|nr:TonB-dependent receptor [Solitalea longa]POY38422.1 TonB-dependent receptor [Solitalea longa]